MSAGRICGGRSMGAMVIASWLAITGCAGSETGNGQRPERPRRPVAVEMRLVAPGSQTLIMADREGTGFEIEAAFVYADTLDLILPSGESCDALPAAVSPDAARCGAQSDRLRVSGGWVVDLVSGAFDPPLDGLEIVEGAFERIELKIRPGSRGLGPDGAVGDGDPLDGASLDVMGTVALDGGPTPFGLTLDLNVTARFGESTIFVADDTDLLELTLDVRPWLESLSLGSCIAAGAVPTVDGVVRLEAADRQACGNVANAVRSGLSATGQARARDMPAQSNR